jgi:hypothetical protein
MTWPGDDYALCTGSMPKGRAHNRSIRSQIQDPIHDIRVESRDVGGLIAELVLRSRTLSDDWFIGCAEATEINDGVELVDG